MANDHLFKMIRDSDNVDVDTFHKAMATYVSHVTGGRDGNTTLLMEACDIARTDVVRVLVKLYPEREHLFACDTDGWTALMFSALNEKTECLRVVCAAIADPDTRCEMIRMRSNTPEGWTALMIAAFHGCADAVEVLLDLCPSAIEDVCINNSMKNAEAMIEHGDTEKTRAIFATFWEKKRRATKGISITTE